MDIERKKRLFPSYFANFNYDIPVAATQQEITVYRACPTRKVERDSFLNSFEENGCVLREEWRIDDPQIYSLSAYENPKHLRRFVVVSPKYDPPYTLAKGHTTIDEGLSCRTKEWKPGYRGSHVDWWLFNGAQPWLAFCEVNYEQEIISWRK